MSLIWAIKAQQTPLAVIEFRKNSMKVDGLFPNELVAERVLFEQLRQKWDEGKDTAQRYAEMLGENYSKSSFVLYPNDGKQSILDLIFFAQGLLERSEGGSTDLSDEEIKKVISNPDLWIYKYDIQTESQSYDCLYKPFQNKCCQQFSQIFPELSNKVLMQNRRFEAKRMLKNYLVTQFSPQEASEALDRNSLSQLINRLEDMRAKRHLEELDWKLSKSGSSLGAHNLLHQLYLDLDNLLTQISEGLPFKKLATSMVHLSNMIDISVALRIVSAECLHSTYSLSASSTGKETECTNIKIPNVIQFEVYRVDYNLFVKVFVDGKQYAIHPQWHGLTSAFNTIRFLDSLDTSDYYIMCNHGQNPRVNRAQIKSDKLNKYFLWFGVVISILLIIQRVRERKQGKQTKQTNQRSEVQPQPNKAPKPKRE